VYDKTYIFQFWKIQMRILQYILCVLSVSFGVKKIKNNKKLLSDISSAIKNQPMKNDSYLSSMFKESQTITYFADQVSQHKEFF
jgi:hypothetical protein